MKKNHINFAHPNKWSDSLASLVESPSIATEIVTGGRTKNKNLKKNRVWSRHHSLFWKTKEKPKQKSKVCEKPDFRSRSRLRVGKVLALHNVHSKTVPLIKCSKVMWFFQNINFSPRVLIKECTKNNKTIF